MNGADEKEIAKRLAAELTAAFGGDWHVDTADYLPPLPECICRCAECAWNGVHYCHGQWAVRS
jgi:hypothetical protein